MPAPLIAAAAVPAITAGIGKAGTVLNMPIIGYKKTTIKRSKTKETIREANFQLRGWEAMLGGAAIALIYYLYKGGFGNGTNKVMADLLLFGKPFNPVTGQPNPETVSQLITQLKDLEGNEKNYAVTVPGLKDAFNAVWYGVKVPLPDGTKIAPPSPVGTAVPQVPGASGGSFWDALHQVTIQPMENEFNKWFP